MQMRALVVGVGVVLVGVLAILAARQVGADEPLERVAGDNRITTSVAASQAGWSASDAAVVATAEDYPDALAAGALAAAMGAPLLLTSSGELPPEVAEEVDRLEAMEVVVIGGEGAVSSEVLDALAASSEDRTVRRVGGADRWETAAAIVAEAGAPSGEVVVASGEDFPDAVSAGALTATPARIPVLLTQGDALPDPTAEALDGVGDVRRVFVVGGPAAVSDEVVGAIAGLGKEVTRLSGEDRFATSVVVAEVAFDRFTGEERPAVFATGADFPDALSAGALAAQVGGPLVLTPADEPGQALHELLRPRSAVWTDSLVVGGSAAVSDEAVSALSESLTFDPDA